MALYGGRASSDGGLKRVGFAIFRSRILVGLVAPFSFETFDISGGCGMLNRLPLSEVVVFLVGLNKG